MADPGCPDKRGSFGVETATLLTRLETPPATSDPAGLRIDTSSEPAAPAEP